MLFLILLPNIPSRFMNNKFVKECLIAAIESFRNSLTLKEAASIPLSDKTVKSRIDDMANSLERKLKSILASCSFFFYYV